MVDLPGIGHPFEADKMIRKNGGDFLVGNYVTYADILACCVLDNLAKAAPQCLEDLPPTLTKLMSEITSNPGIADHVRKRPDQLSWEGGAKGLSAENLPPEIERRMYPNGRSK